MSSDIHPFKQAKDVGNYHPALKQLYEATPAKPDRKNRDKGLRMGVGSFSGGVLKLRRNDISAITRSEASGLRERGRGRGRGRGGGRGGGRGRGGSRG